MSDAMRTAYLVRARAALELATADNADPGRDARNYTRSIIARALAFTMADQRDTEIVASDRWGADGAAIAKAAVGAMTGAQTAEHDAFFGLAADQSLLGKLPLRRWPFGLRTLASAGLGGGEVPEGGATPMRVASLATFRLAERKFQSALLVTRESIERGGAVVESGLQRDLLQAAADAVDAGFVADLVSAAGTFAGDHRFAVALLHPADAATHATDTLNVTGGWFNGYPAFTSNAVAPGSAILVDASRIAADWTPGAIDFGDQATVQADSSPTQNSVTPTATQSVSMFATNSVVIRSTIGADWNVPAGVVAVIALAS